MGGGVNVFLESLVEGFSDAAVYMVLAAGLALIFGVLQLLNFAQGDVMSLAAYVCLSTVSVTSNFIPLLIAVAVGLGAAFGVVFYVGIVQPLRRHDHRSQLVATYGLSLVIQGVIFLVWTGEPRSITQNANSVSLGSVHIGYTTLLNVVLAALSLGAVGLLLARTSLGRRIRATSQNRMMAELTGINTWVPEITAVVLGMMLSGVGGVMLLEYSQLQPSIGFSSITNAFAIVIIAGPGAPIRAIVGVCIALSLLSSLVGTYVSFTLGSLVFFGAIIVALVIRPAGVGARALRT